jgi:LPPG:FO 2-phospho-L-lactate transferase
MDPARVHLRVTAIAGGTGAAKLLRGLAATLGQQALTIVGNTGDDAEVWGLHVSPDLDTVTYALAGVLDLERGWGRSGESFRCLEGMATLGAETWFSLGDRDLATHLVRTQALREGQPLSRVTAAIARSLGVTARLLPMSDDAVRTRIRTPDGWLTFQEYFVRDKALVEVLDVAYAGARAARPAPGVLEALRETDLVVVCPSNPVTSVGPLLAVPGILEALSTTRAPVVAVSPILANAAVSGPAAALMRARGLPVSPAGVAAAYAPWLRTLVLDRRDAGEAPALGARGVTPVLADILMTDRESEIALARVVLGEPSHAAPEAGHPRSEPASRPPLQ